MILVDPPNAAGHGRLWSHLASDVSYAELHAFAERLGVPSRGFDRDHYDVPAEWYDRVVALGATPVSSRELATRLVRAGLRRRRFETLGQRRPGRTLVRPPRLRVGDAVAVVAPSGRVDADRLAAGIEVLREWGLDVRSPTPTTGDAPAYLFDTDAGRVAALTAAWTDPDVRAVFAARGGYGAQRLVDLLDWDLLAAAGPKLLVGFSDVTALLEAFGHQLGLATIHGAHAASLAEQAPATVASLRRLVLDGACPTLTGLTPGRPGVASGVLVGGNLAVLASGVGSPTGSTAQGAIAVLEDVGEAPYRLDRMLTQLLRSGWFAGVRGVVLGSFTRCGDSDEVRAVLDDRLGPLGVPTAYDAPIGHGDTNLALPLGLPATLDADAGTLTVTAHLR